MPRWLLGLAIVCVSNQGFALEPLAHWRCEGKPDEALASLSAVQDGWLGKPSGEVAFAGDVPGPFVYDPLTGKSARNTTSLRFRGGESISIPWPEGQTSAATSFTLELFFRPAEPNAGIVAMKSRSTDRATQFGIQPIFLQQWGQTYCGGYLIAPQGKPTKLQTGNYLSSSRIHSETLGWRHAALVYDAKTKRATYYNNYYESKTEPIEAELVFDAAPLFIGGAPSGEGFRGLIDEVRYTPASLRPHQFLRARADEVANVSFESQPTVLPRESGYIDVKEAFGAVGDGKTDDTAAFNAAFKELANKIPLAYHTLYIPPGEYLVSDTIAWSRFLFVQGAGPDKTLIRLKDNCPGFDDPEKPRPVVKASSTEGPPGSTSWVNGSSIGNYACDFAIDTGKNNPGAKGFEYHANNHGIAERLVIRSGDGQGTAGLDLTHKTNGPALIKNVAIEGFDYGVTFTYQEYSMTLEHLKLSGQRKAGIHNAGNIMALRNVHSRNSVPAIVSLGGNSMITLLDSALVGGSASEPAIRCEGALYVRGLHTDGYQKAVEKKVFDRVGEGDAKKTVERIVEVAGPDIAEYVGDRIICLRGEARGSLKLPIEETPEVPRGDIDIDWVNVRAFEAQVKDGDWTPAIQAAIDSGAKTVYFPPGGYQVFGTVHLRGSVERLHGMGMPGLHRPKDGNRSQPAVIFDEPSAGKTVLIENLNIHGLTHASPSTLVVRSTDVVPYHNQPGCGKLFLENVAGEGWHFDHPQQVWCRQWNPEAHGPGPCITSKGATIWSLGFKTEYESSKLWASDGAKTEILGAFIYPVTAEIPKDRPIFKNIDSEMAVVYGTSVYVANHDTHIIDEQKGEKRTADNSHLLWMGSRARMDLYASHPFAAAEEQTPPRGKK